jgi:hypothetical protein
VESPEVNPSESKPERLTFDDNLTRLAPDWKRRQKQGQVRMKTFLRLYLSKWFWRGLEWFEIEFLEILISKLNLEEKYSFFEDRSQFRRRGINVAVDLYLKDIEKPINLKGFDLMDFQELMTNILSETDFLALWKLGSVQSLRDHIFVPVTGHEHEGKKNITKARIRGYRDGKGSLRDSNLIKMSLKVDQVFYEHEYHRQWDEVEREFKRLTKT